MVTSGNPDPPAATSQQSFDQLVANIDGIVWEGNARTFQFTFVSQQAERLLGYPVSDWLEPGFWVRHLHQDDREWAVAFCSAAVTERRSHDFEYRFVAAGGRVVWLRDIVTVVVEGSEPTKLRGVMVDVTRAKEAEAALRASEELHRLVTDNSRDLIVLFDTAARYIYASPSYHRLVGHVPATSFGHVHPDDLAEVRRAFEVCAAGGTARAVFRTHAASGEWRWLDSRGAWVQYEGRPHVLSVSRDITDERRAEEERRAHLWFLESLDRVNRAIQASDDLDRMLGDVLDAVLTIFDCDRAWLVYPCDPRATTWRATRERTRPEFPGAFAFGRDLPVEPGIRAAFRAMRETAGPVRFGPGAHEIAGEAIERFQVKAMLAMAIYPKVDQPYAFGLHQCRGPRSWTVDDERLLQEIGRRIADALTSLLVLRDLRASEGKLAEAEVIAHVGYWENDLDADRITWSGETYRIFGLSPAEGPLDLARVVERVHPEDRARWERATRAAIHGEAPLDLEYRVVRPDGEVRVVHSQAAPARGAAGATRRMFGAVQDITERRRAEERLRASEARFRTFVDHATDAFFLLDDRRIIVDVNARACDALGFSPAELCGLRLDDFDLSGAAFLDAVDERLRAGEMVTFDSRHRRRDGSELPVEVRIRRFRHDGAWLAVALARDVSERLRAEEALRASEREFRATFELAAAGAAQADPVTGRLVRVNRKLCALLGYSSDELLGTDFAALTHPEDRDRDVTSYERLVRGEIADYAVEKRMIRKDGGEVWMRVSGGLIRDAEGRPVRTIAIGEDITERKRAEDELRASEGRFRTFVDHATDAFFLHDAGGTIVDVNQQACEFLGYSRDELIGMGPWQIDADHDGPALGAIAERLAAGETITLETHHRRKDGSVFPVELRVRPFWHGGRRFGMSLVRDMTERERAQRALVESHALLRAVIEGTSDAVFVKDREGRYELINSAGAQLLGKRVEEVLGRDDRAVFTPDSAGVIMARDREIMANGAALTSEEVATSGGVTRTYLTSKSARRDAQGHVTGLIGIARDVTELKRLEDQLRQSQKMEAVGRLAGGIAHDFNNLLTIVNVNSNFILNTLAAQDPNRELLVDILGAGRRAANLTRQLLAFSRRQMLLPQIVNVNDLLRDLVKLLARLIGEDIELELATAPDLGLARIDRGQFEQAIVNLAVNARDAMPRGGRLIIATGNTELDADFAALHPEVEPGRYLRVAVTDTGHGMDADTLGRVFEPFFTTKEPGKGTGLGLAMVYGFVKQSDGHVEVHSEPGVGSTFELFLPLAEGATAPSRPVREAVRLPHGKETILVVEDEDAVRKLVQRVLEKNGYTVLVARDGEDALVVAAQHPGTIHLVVSDLVMPRSGGREMATELLKVRPDVRVLFMSGYTDEAVLREGRDGGDEPAVPFLYKPFTAVALIEKVREVLDARGA